MADLNIAPGDTVEVDFSVTNSGELEDTQDVVLVSENGSRMNVDRIQDVTLQPDGSTTGTLVWEDVPEGSYTLYAETDDASDSITVSAITIPDLGDYQWHVDAGSGTTLDPDLGSVSGTLADSSMWISASEAVGGYALDHQNSFSWESGSTILDPPFTVAGWIKPASYGSGHVWMGQANGDLRVEATSTDTLTTAFGGSTYISANFVPAGSWGFAALSVDSESGEHRLITFDNSGELSDNTNSNWTNIDDNLQVGDYNSSGNYFDGLSDFHVVSEGSLLSKTDITDLWEATKR